MDVLAGLLAFASLLVILLGLITLIHPMRRLRIATRKRAGLVLAGGVAAFILAAALTPPLPPSAPAKPESAPPAAGLVASKPALQPKAPAETSAPQLSGSDLLSGVDGMKTAKINGKTLTVTASMHPLSAELYFTDVADLIGSIGRALTKDPGSTLPLDDVVLTVSAPAIDRLGRESNEPFVKVTLSADDLRKANFHNLDYGQTLDLTKDAALENGAGLEAVRAFCAQSGMGRSSSSFCPFMMTTTTPTQ